MPVQSVVFKKAFWSRQRAEAWLRKHGFEATPVDEKEDTWRYRQQEPRVGAKYFTKKLAGYPGVDLVIDLGSGAGKRKVEEPEEEEALDAAYEPAPDEGGDIFCVKRETSDQELDAWGKKNIKGFKGVVARDQFEQLYPRDTPMEPGSSCIVNLDYGDYARGGTHWTAARVSQEEPKLLYFDAFGMPPPRQVSLRAMAEGRGVQYPDIQYQGLDETNCGPRALAALHFLAQEAAKGRELEAFDEIGQV